MVGVGWAAGEVCRGTGFFFLLLFLSSMVTDEGSLNVCAGAGRVCSHCTGTGAGSCRRRITGRKMTVVVEVTTRG